MINIKRATRQCLAEHNMNQKDLAKKLKVKEAQISVWVNSAHLNTSVIERIAKVFDMKVSEFVALGE